MLSSADKATIGAAIRWLGSETALVLHFAEQRFAIRKDMRLAVS